MAIKPTYYKCNGRKVMDYLMDSTGVFQYDRLSKHLQLAYKTVQSIRDGDLISDTTIRKLKGMRLNVTEYVDFSEHSEPGTKNKKKSDGVAKKNTQIKRGIAERDIVEALDQLFEYFIEYRLAQKEGK